MKVSQTVRPAAGWLRKLFSWFAAFAVLLLLLLPAATHAAKTAPEKVNKGKIVFLPFAVNTIPPQEYLKNGLVSMLATRMTSRTGQAAVHGNIKTGELGKLLQEKNQQEAQKILKKMEGDWLMVGNLEQQKTGGYAIAILVFSSGPAEPASFSRAVASLDKALLSLDELSLEIAAKVFKQEPLPKKEPEPAAAKEEKGGADGFQTAHPERAYIERLHQEAAPSMDDGAFSILSAQSQDLPAPIRSLEVGDLDGDGSQEIVLLEQGNLALYHLAAGRLQRIIDQPLPDYLSMHRLFLADLDRNGRLEIYVSASSGGVPASFVLEWDGAQFHFLHRNVPYYLRPDIDTSGNPALLGQSGSIQPAAFGAPDQVGPLYRMTVSKDGGLDRAEEIFVPKGFKLYDFIRADMDHDGRREFVGITENNKLVILDQEGKPLWTSEETYGAGRDFLGTLASNQAADRDMPAGRQWNYIHARLVAQDQNGDGRPEIIVSRNRIKEVAFFKRLSSFEGSSVCALSWDGARMHVLWETKQVPGYTIDYQAIGKAGQPNSIILFFAESRDTDSWLHFWGPGSESSTLHWYEMSAKMAAPAGGAEKK